MKTNILHRIIYTTAIMLLTTWGYTQSRHEFSATGGVGLSALNFDTQVGQQSSQWGGLIGLSYTYQLANGFSLLTGAEFSLYRSKVVADRLDLAIPDIIDKEGHLLDFHTSVLNYRETQKAYYINIPLMVQYQMDGATKFYIAGGAKLGIPIAASFKSSQATYVNKGYFPLYDNWLYTEEFMGFGTFKDRGFSRSLALRFMVFASLEVGLKWSIKSSTFYTGLYADYGLGSVKSKSSKAFLEYNYNNPARFAVNGIEGAIKSKVVPIALGLKVRYVLPIKVSRLQES